MEYYGLQLDPFQEQAIQAIQSGKSVLVSAPTGAGKTLIAEYAIEHSLDNNQRIIYTAPLKALSNQKFRDFQKSYGNRIGILTGDVVINPDAPALIMTTEIFRNIIFESPERLADVNYAIFDEVHYLADEERGTVWEESIIFAPKHIKFIALSATISNLNQLANWIRRVHHNNLIVIEEPNRPVPLKHLLFIKNYGIGNLKDLHRLGESTTADGRIRHSNSYIPQQSGLSSHPWKNKLIDALKERNQLPCLYFIFNREGCELRAESNLHKNFLDPAEQTEIINIFNNLCQKYNINQSDSSFRYLKQLLEHGIAYHHAGMLPTMKEIVEQLFTTGLIKLLFATETFALGINMPAKTVVFDTLMKFDGIQRAPLKVLEYQQMAGRAGRRGMDEVGYVYSNIELPYDRFKTINRVISDDVEPVRSQFNLSYSSILSLCERLHQQIYQACAKSLSNFQSVRAHRRPKKQADAPYYGQVVDQLRRKINVLERLRYIQNGQLTPKGELASKLFGYELQLTELYTNHIIERLDPDQLNLLLVSIVFEAKRRDSYSKFDPKLLAPFARPASEIIYDVQRMEKRNGIITGIKPLEFQLSAATYAWSRGEPFSKLAAYTSAAEGDLIRTFRLTVQLHRQLIHTLNNSSSELRSKIAEALRKLCRDEVDAEHQLRLS
jgi:superfamily II RNA helicase